MKLICAWCKLVLLEGELPATHGICVVCSLKLSAIDRTLNVISRLPHCGLPSVRVDCLRANYALTRIYSYHPTPRLRRPRVRAPHERPLWQRIQLEARVATIRMHR